MRSSHSDSSGIILASHTNEPHFGHGSSFDATISDKGIDTHSLIPTLTFILTKRWVWVEEFQNFRAQAYRGASEVKFWRCHPVNSI